MQKEADYLEAVRTVLTGTGQAFAGNQAAKLAAGGGGSPVKGSLNLIPQAVPSAPDTGDIWSETLVGAPRYQTPAGTSWLSKWLFFSGIPGNAASTTYVCVAAANSIAALGTTSTLGTTQYVSPVARGLNLGIKTSQTTVGGTIAVSIFVNGSIVGSNVTITAGTVAGYYSASQSPGFSIPNGATIDIRIQNGTGVTTGLGQIVVLLEVC